MSKIIEFRAENIKNLKVVEIKPDDNTVILEGKNGAGKSAILDAIFTTLTGKKIKNPIRKGQDRAEVSVELENIVIKKIFTNKAERLEVKTREGTRFDAPQSYLNKRIGQISFDPLEFGSMKQKDQLEFLKSLVGLDFNDLNEEYQKIYQDRVAVNRLLKESHAQLSSIEAPDPNTPNKELSFKEELEHLDILREKKQDYDYAQKWISQAHERINELKEDIDLFNQKIVEARQEIDGIREKIEQYNMPVEVTQTQLHDQQEVISQIEQKNMIIKSAKRYRELVKEAEKRAKDADQLTQKLKRIEQDKQTRIANSKFPIPGLAINDDSVTYNKTPFSNLSTGEKIRVSTAIAMALNPELKTIFIRDGSLLDQDGLKTIINMASEKDYQIWIEVVSESQNQGIYIEDGSINP